MFSCAPLPIAGRGQFETAFRAGRIDVGSRSPVIRNLFDAPDVIRDSRRERRRCAERRMLPPEVVVHHVSATDAAWFSIFLKTPLVKRVKSRSKNLRPVIVDSLDLYSTNSRKGVRSGTKRISIHIG